MFRYFILSTRISVYNTKVKLHIFYVAQTHRRLTPCLVVEYVLESDGKWLLSIWPLPDFSVMEPGSEIRTRSISNPHFLLPYNMPRYELGIGAFGCHTSLPAAFHASAAGEVSKDPIGQNGARTHRSSLIHESDFLALLFVHVSLSFSSSSSSSPVSFD